MKTKLYFSLVLVFALAFSAPKVNAQTLIQFWDFNNTWNFSGLGGDSLGTVYSYANSVTTDTTGGHATYPLNANYVAGSLTAGHIVFYRPQTKYGSTGKRDSILDNGTGAPFCYIYDYSSNKYSYYVTSDSSHTGGNMFIRARNPCDSNTMYIYIPTTGYKNIMFDFAISASSSKGANYGIFAYSTNGGTSWNNLTTTIDTFNIGGTKRPDTLQLQNPTTAGSNWYPCQMDFTSVTSVNNNANFVIRMMLAGPNTDHQTSGNARFDNFSVWGTSASTDVDNVSTQDAGYKIYPNPTGDYINIVSQNSGDKIATVYNVEGQMVSVTKYQGLQTSINMSSLNAGVYFVEIQDASGNNKYTERIVKQ